MPEIKAPFRTTYNQLVKFIQAQPSRTKGGDPLYPAWLLARDIGLAREGDRGMLELTQLGRQFLEADTVKRRDIFRSAILKSERFSPIWHRTRTRASETEGRITRDAIEETLKNLTGIKTPKMVNLHTGTILNWATNAGLLERDKHMREGVYDLMPVAQFGHLVSDVPTVIQQEPVEIHRDFDYLKELSLIVYDLLGEPRDKDALDFELRRISEKWALESSAEGPISAYKQIISNEILTALEFKDRRLFEMLAKTLRIIRKKGALQSTLEEYGAATASDEDRSRHIQ